MRKRFGRMKLDGVAVISVGNISAGGTGKSVFCQYLLSILEKKKHGALILRGYKGSNESTSKSLLVSYQQTMFTTVEIAGDEASMHATMTSALVVVGKDRLESTQVAYKFFSNAKIPLDYLLLDDAYQNHALYKNCEILLLDARFPTENGHCFPAGRLREKDCSRADIIVFTHAQDTNQLLRYALIENYCTSVDRSAIFFGMHQRVGYFLNGVGSAVSACLLKEKRGCVFAGIGSFSNFLHMVERDKLTITCYFNYKDHHAYHQADLETIETACKKHDIDYLVTTRKDWVKLTQFLQQGFSFTVPVYVLDVTFEFLTLDEEIRFIDTLKKRVSFKS